MHHILVRWLPFPIISNRHAEARSWKRAPRWWISSKKNTPTFPGRVLYSKVSMHCTINAEHQACEVQHLLLQFLGLSCRLWWNVRHRTTYQLKASHQQKKSDRKYAEDFPWIFMGCETSSSQHLDIIWVETLFTSFFVAQNSALSASDHDICSGARFCKSKLRRRTIYIYMYTLRSESNSSA